MEEGRSSEGAQVAGLKRERDQLHANGDMSAVQKADMTVGLSSCSLNS
jgi:hypothetical protein